MSDVIPVFTRDQYLNTSEPYEWITSFADDGFRYKQLQSLMSAAARQVGCTNFLSILKTYVESQAAQNGFDVEKNYTEFSGFKDERQFKSGKYKCSDDGVSYTNGFGTEIVVCSHPILPIRRLVNIDTNTEKIEIAYRRGNRWRTQIVSRGTLANKSEILSLADVGVAVTNTNAGELSDYIAAMEAENYDELAEVSSVGRLGWIEDYGFSPYVDNLAFDGEAIFRSYFDSVKPCGELDKWLDAIRAIRQENKKPTLMMLAASFASVLIAPCSLLPFFCHLHGGTEAGKTVALMMCASVWANPEMGKYIHSFNSTSVAQEQSASFCNSLPLILDELQIIKDRKNFDNTIYQLCEGVGRARGQKQGGLQKTATWSNCILTSGEFPISSGNSGAGAVNRIIEVDLADGKMFDNPIEFLASIKGQYGTAGKAFIEWLQADEANIEEARSLQKKYYAEIVKGQTTEKQSASAALILAADELIERVLFKDGIRLTVSDIVPYLATKEQVSQNVRALSYIYDYVAVNSAKFSVTGDGYGGEIWGKIQGGYVYIIKSQFDKLMNEQGFNPSAFLSWARINRIIETVPPHNTVTARINGSVARCVKLKEPEEKIEDSQEEDDDLPDF